MLDYGVREMISYTAQDGSVYARPLLVGPPRCLFKSEQQPLCITFKFKCPYEYCNCQKTYAEKEAMKRRGERVFPCPFNRQIKIVDSFLFIGAKLDTIIEQVHEAGNKEGLSWEQTFPSTLAFLRSRNLDDRQIALVIKNKFQMPHEAIRSYEDLIREECPTADMFGSFLRGTTRLSDDEMDIFRLIWRELEIPNLLTLYDYYVRY